MMGVPYIACKENEPQLCCVIFLEKSLSKSGRAV